MTAGDPPDGRPAPGSAFGDFRLLRRVARGSADVFLAEQRDGTRVALKLLRRGRGDATRLRRFARGSRALARMRHPSICPVHEAGEVDGVPFLSMEWVPGRTLAAWIDARRARREPAPDGAWREVVGWGEQLARALQAAHERGFVHRDVKPHNVMLTPDGRAVLLDFGLAAELGGADRSEAPDAAPGTPAYMPPEQIRGHGGSRAPTGDVYSLGATLFECLTLERPFDAPTHAALQHRVLAEDCPDVRRRAPWLPQGLSIVLRTALHRQPGRRYASAAAFADDLARVRRGARPAARPPGPIERASRWVRRNPAVAALIALLATTATVLVWQQERAVGARRGADRTLRELEQVSRGVVLRRAMLAADALFPAWPERIGALERWLREDGEPLSALLAELRAASVAAGAPVARGAETASAYVARARAELVRELEAFTAPGGVVDDVRSRLDWARSVRARTIDEHRRAWDATIRGVRESPRYAKLELEPQLGLIPLGENPATGLFEFYHLRSSAEATSVPAARRPDGGFDVRPETGIVFVLLPGGEVTVGERNDAPTRDALQTVRLDAFFVSKYEMTQAQWRRLSGGEEPSFHAPRRFPDQPPPRGAYPVERVTAPACDALLARHGLALPTDVQWEYACRAGADTAWSTGPDAASLIGSANLGSWRPAGDALIEFPDGHGPTAPVGSFRPNAFGLYDVHGNVVEWCRDPFSGSPPPAPRPGDGLRSGDATGSRTTRGGACSSRAELARCSHRGGIREDNASRSIGLRPMRSVLR